MDNFYEQLKNEAHKTVLTRAEKSAMKARIFGAASPVGTSTASPYFFYNFQFKHAFVPVLALLVVLFGTGTAYAAEGSLPGNPLYAVKVNITEPLQTALAVTAEGRAEVHIAIAQKRVEEAEALATAGTLDATTSDQLQQNFDEHTEAADALALEVGHNDPAAAVELQARADSNLSVHGAILATLAGESTNADTRTNGERLAMAIAARAHTSGEATAVASSVVALKVATTLAAGTTGNQTAGSGEGESRQGGARIQTFAATVPTTATASATGTVAVVPTTPTPTPTPASSNQGSNEGSDTNETQPASSDTHTNEQSQLQVRAEGALKDAQSQYKDSKSKLSASAATAVDAQLAQVQADIDSGDYTSALQLSLKLQAVLKAQSKYRGNIIPLLQLRLDTNDSGHDN